VREHLAWVAYTCDRLITSGVQSAGVVTPEEVGRGQLTSCEEVVRVISSLRPAVERTLDIDKYSFDIENKVCVTMRCA
jgi:hypothetical protein